MLIATPDHWNIFFFRWRLTRLCPVDLFLTFNCFGSHFFKTPQALSRLWVPPTLLNPLLGAFFNLTANCFAWWFTCTKDMRILRAIVCHALAPSEYKAPIAFESMLFLIPHRSNSFHAYSGQQDETWCDIACRMAKNDVYSPCMLHGGDVYSDLMCIYCICKFILYQSCITLHHQRLPSWWNMCWQRIIKDVVVRTLISHPAPPHPTMCIYI